MTDQQWQAFFKTCSRMVGPGTSNQAHSESWCAWTTFGSLKDSVHYWSAGLPSEEYIASDHIRDSGPWGQPFLYRDIAHIILPRQFYWELATDLRFTTGTKHQNLDALSLELHRLNILHRITPLVLEIKLY